jgi:hypothetical protein
MKSALKISIASLIIFLFIFGPMNKSFSQKLIPGYIGKKNAVGYTSGISMGFNSSELTGSIGFIVQHNFCYERVIGRKAVFAINGTFAPSKYPFKEDLNFNVDYDESYPIDKYYSFEAKGFTRAYAASASIGIKFFKDRFVAPIGRFIKIQMGYMRYGIMNWEEGIAGTYEIKEANTTNQTYQKSGFLKSADNFKTGILLSFGFGKIVPINDHLVFEYGNNLNFNLSPDYDFNLLEGVYGSSQNDYPSVEDYIFSGIYNRLKFRNLFDFNFGLKYNF